MPKPALKKQTIKEPYGGKGREKALIAGTEDSMAENPAFEEDAKKFEKNLGALAYGHSASNEVVDAASKKVLAYIDKRAKTVADKSSKLEKKEEEIRLLKGVVGAPKQKYTGLVGAEADKIRKVFASGKLGERCNHIEGFYKNILLPDLLNPDAKPDTGKGGADIPALGKKGLNDALVEADVAIAQLKKRTKGKKDVWDTYDEHDEDSPLGQQWRTRQNRDDANDKKKRSKNHTDRPYTSPKLGEVEMDGPQVKGEAKPRPGVELSDDEKAFQGVSGAGDSTKWVTGEGSWVMNEAHKWVAAQRALSLPLVAGPSGTTDRLMQTFQGLGVGKPSTRRLACIGYLLPPSHHSLVEVLTGAAPHGIGFTEGQKMYMNIKPLSPAELRACGDGKYPHERHKK